MKHIPEFLVNSTQAADILGIPLSQVTAVRRALGLSRPRFPVADIRRFLDEHPDFFPDALLAPAGPVRVSPALAPEAVSSAPVAEVGSSLEPKTPGEDAPSEGDSELSQLAQAILLLMAQRHITAKEITRRTHARGHRLGSSYLSRILTGVQTYMATPDLTALAQALGNTPHDHFVLCRARLLDECPSMFRTQVRILSTLNQRGGEAAYPFTRLTLGGRAALRALLRQPPPTFDDLLAWRAAQVPKPPPDAPVRHLALAMADLIERTGATVKDVTRKSRALGDYLGSSYLSRLTTGIQTWVGAKRLEILVAGWSENLVEQAELVRASLYDQCPPFAWPWLRVKLLGEDHSDEKLLETLSARGQQALLHLLNHQPNPEPGLRDLARFAGLN